MLVDLAEGENGFVLGHNLIVILVMQDLPKLRRHTRSQSDQPNVCVLWPGVCKVLCNRGRGSARGSFVGQIDGAGMYAAWKSNLSSFCLSRHLCKLT